MSYQKQDKIVADQEDLIRKLKQAVTMGQRMLAAKELQMRRLAQEVRELKTENAYLKEKVRRNG